MDNELFLPDSSFGQQASNEEDYEKDNESIDYSHSEGESSDQENEPNLNTILTFLDTKNNLRLTSSPINLVSTVTVIDCIAGSTEDEASNGLTSGDVYGNVYVVGTAHFSLESQQDVADTIQKTQPDIVMVELCPSRVSILSLDEDKLLEEAKNMNLEKVKMSIKQSGFVQGIMYCLLLSMSAHVTKQLGMAPGGEFRTAFREYQKIPICKLHLGDRPVQITLQRAFGTLSIWQKMRFFFRILWSHNSKITKEDVEKAKQRDLLEALLREMAGEFPDLSRIFIQERDQYMAYVLKQLVYGLYKSRRKYLIDNGFPANDVKKYPVVVVGVVGMGHVPGIAANWNQVHDISQLLKVPQRKPWSPYVKWCMRSAVLGLVSCAFYKCGTSVYTIWKNW